MFGLTTFGAIHTLISLVALGAGLVALARTHEISPSTNLGQVYLWMTVLTCITGFGIFHHGGFGKPHWLGVMTLAVLALAMLAFKTDWFGRAGQYIVTICFSLTVFFHFIPAATETFTRLPTGAPLFTSPDDPNLQKVIAVFVCLLTVGLALQIMKLRKAPIKR